MILANISLYGINAIIDSRLNKFIFPNIGFLINLALVYGGIIFFRICVRLLFEIAKASYGRKGKAKKLLVYDTNVSLMDLIDNNPLLEFKVAGFITAAVSNAKNKTIAGRPVYYIEDILNHTNVSDLCDAILIAPTEMNPDEKQILADYCIRCKIDLLSTTAWQEWNSSKEEIRLNKINIEDLLGRPPIHIDSESIGRQLDGKTVLVTGAAGSIGSEIVRQISNYNLKSVILLDIAESPLHQLHIELLEKNTQINYVPVICDTKHIHQLDRVYAQYKPDCVYHAAAYKHVPMMEIYPCEAVLTNIQGSMNAADLAVKYGVEVFVMISTDKAVNPTNVMGASKRIMEIYIQSLSRKLGSEAKQTRFIITRFGNVLGSNGSVVPLFKKQIQKGGPLTVTHPDIVRYFMTIPEACRLVLEAGNFGQGGEVFVFDMGEPVKIINLAQNMIRLSGLEVGKDIEIVYTQLRPGEKLYEELYYNREVTKLTANKKILIDSVREYNYHDVVPQILNLIETAKLYDDTKTVRIMKQIVPEYISQNSVYSKIDDDLKRMKNPDI
ncbi:MAG: polysaccharide biosynthesis protein [Prevotellaceae bacterium]|nr:polysaccharide biosynthesis protein [Prevotellaceae bacterium]